MRLIFLGGVDIGGSCIVFETQNFRGIVDVGMVQRQNCSPEPPQGIDYLRGKKIDAIFITHAHLDHLGAGPLIAALHPEARIICAPPTRAIAGIMLPDVLKVAEKKCHAPLFSEDEMINFFRRLEGDKTCRWRNIADVGYRLWPAGHMRGGASVHISSPEGSALFTGDINNIPAPTVSGAFEVADFWPDVLVIEATNGDENLVPRSETEEDLIRNVKRIVKKGGNVLLPAFSLRVPDIALTLASAGINSFVGGLGAKIFDVFLDNPENWVSDIKIDYALVSRYVRCFTNIGEASYVARGRGNVVVSSNGWLQGGWSRTFLEHWIGIKENAVFLTGWQKPEFSGARLLRAKPGDTILLDGRHKVTKKAEIKQFRLSGHAGQEDLVAFAKSVFPQTVVLSHGDKNATDALSLKIREEGLKTKRAEILQPIEI